jgi:hypothetical protein
MGASRVSKVALMLPAFLVVLLLIPIDDASQRQSSQNLVGEAHFSKPGQLDSQLEIDVTTPSHIFVPVTIGDSRPLWFILDSAATTSCVSARVARELSLGSDAVGTVSGSGEHSETVEVIHHLTLKLDGAEFSTDNVPAIPSESEERSFGRAIDGVIGYDFISHFVVEVDYAARVLKLHDPRSFKYSGAGRRFPVTILAKQPCLSLAVTMPGRKPIDGVFHVDSGATTAVEFFRPFVESQNLVSALQRSVEVKSSGVGGDISSVYGRIDSVGLGEYKVVGPIASFSLARAGATSSTAAAGLIGGKFLRRFKVIFDQPHDSMVFEPNESFRGGPDRYDTVGVRLMAGGPNYRRFWVNQVLPHSPADEAGLRPDDVILSVDGKLAASFSLDELRGLFMEEDKQLSISVERSGEQLPVTIKTRRLL